MGPMPNHVSACCGTWCVLPEGMSQMFRLLYLSNGWADCVEIWHALGDPLVTAYAVVTGGVSLHVRTCRDAPTPRLALSLSALLTLAPLGGGGKGPPLWFFANSS